jgi:hypothetical protein
MDVPLCVSYCMSAAIVRVMLCQAEISIGVLCPCVDIEQDTWRACCDVPVDVQWWQTRNIQDAPSDLRRL